MLKTIVLLFLITLLPGLELRASIPMGILGGKWIASPLPWPAVIAVCIASNILIGWTVFFVLEPLVKFLRRFAWCNNLLSKYLDHSQAKLKPSVDKYGFWGLAIFIGIPLPLTGSYTGAAGAYALGMEKRQFMLANVAGVLMAATCVTIVTLLIQAGCDLPFFKYLINTK